MLRVYPNPFLCFDKDGNLTGAVRFDPDHGRRGEVHHVGAKVRQRVKPDANEATAPLRIRRDIADDKKGSYVARGVLDPLREVAVEYQVDIVEIPHSDYHVRMLRDLALIPADEPTAKLARLTFVQPLDALNAARERLVQTWEENYPEEEVPDWPTAEELLAKPNPSAPAAPAGRAPLPIATPSAPASGGNS